VFWVYVAVMVPFPEPEGVAVHHVELLAAVQFELEVTLNVAEPSIFVTFWLAGVTVSVAAAPDCETVTVSEGIPLTVTVIVATLGVVEEFAE